MKQQSDDSDADSGEMDAGKEDADVRDIRYNLEILPCICIFTGCFFETTMLTNDLYIPKTIHLSTYDLLKLALRVLRKDLSAKDRNLCVRNVTWVFAKVFWLSFYLQY